MNSTTVTLWAMLGVCVRIERVGAWVLLHTGWKVCQQATKVLKEHESFSLTFIQLLIKPLAVSRLWDLGALPNACAWLVHTLLYPGSSLGCDAHVLCL